MRLPFLTMSAKVACAMNRASNDGWEALIKEIFRKIDSQYPTIKFKVVFSKNSTKILFTVQISSNYLLKCRF